MFEKDKFNLVFMKVKIFPMFCINYKRSINHNAFILLKLLFYFSASLVLPNLKSKKLSEWVYVRALYLQYIVQGGRADM